MLTHNHDILIVEELSLFMSIGIYEREKAAPQRVLVSVEATTLPNIAHESDDISDALSYEHMVRGITDLAATKHYDLVESFAEEIAGALFAHKQVQSLKISVKKPDIFENVAAVGITIFRSRP